MRTSESIEHIAAAMVAMQADARHANFDSKNPHYKSRYASLAEVIDTVRPVLAKHGLAVLQLPGFRPDVGHVLVTRVIHSSGQWIEEEMKLNPTKEDPQGLGSSITYARRYSLPGACLIASEEDDDGNAGSGLPPRPTAPPAPVAPKLSPEELADKRQAYLDQLETLNDETIIKTTFMAAAAGLGLTKGSPEFTQLRQLFVDRIEAIKPK